MSLSDSRMSAGTAAMALGWGECALGPVSGDRLAARSLAMVGAIGMMSVPLLLTASPLVHAPLGAPAAIAMGYLAAAWYLRFGQNRGATAWILAVQCGLVLWTVIYSASAAGTLSWADFAAVLLAPAFAAAPALVRRMLAQNLEQARVSAREERVEHPAQDTEGQRSQESADVGGKSVNPAVGPIAVSAVAKPICDLGGAIAFALRRAEPAMHVRDICLLRQQSSSLAVACDPRLCRQIVTTLLDCALSASPAGGTVKIEARSLKGAVLFRVIVDHPAQGYDMLDRLSASLARTAINSLVEAAGATLLTGKAGEGASASLRLASAPDAPAECSAKYAGDV